MLNQFIWDHVFSITKCAVCRGSSLKVTKLPPQIITIRTTHLVSLQPWENAQFLKEIIKYPRKGGDFLVNTTTHTGFFKAQRRRSLAPTPHCQRYDLFFSHGPLVEFRSPWIRQRETQKQTNLYRRSFPLSYHFCIGFAWEIIKKAQMCDNWIDKPKEEDRRERDMVWKMRS